MFPRYYVLEQLLKNHKPGKSLKNYYILSVQHLLRSTGSLFEALIRFGFSPEHIFLTGKIYSAHDKTIVKLKQLCIQVQDPTLPDKLGYYSDFLEKDIQILWEKLSESIRPNSKIIILDDGGFALKSVPDNLLQSHQVFGIEQTTSGIRLQDTFKKFPVIHVASSAAKTLIEPPIVSEAVRIQLGGIISDLNPNYIGIIGYGHIGKALASDLCKDYRVGVYDRGHINIQNPNKNIELHNSKTDLYRLSDVIIGATGEDISDESWLTNSNGDKTLISVSSGDIEFNSILKKCHDFLLEPIISPLQDLKLKTSHGDNLLILRGGLVANFTGKPDSSPGHIIQMTRGLLLSSIIQSIKLLKDNKSIKGEVPLDHRMQKEVISSWFNDQPNRKADYQEEILCGFEDVIWIGKLSFP